MFLTTECLSRCLEWEMYRSVNWSLDDLAEVCWYRWGFKCWRLAVIMGLY